MCMSPEDKKYPTLLQKRVMWTALSLLSLAFIIVLACACAVGLVKLFVVLEAVLLPVLIAGILAYLLNPVVLWLQRYVVKRVWAVLIVMLSALLLVAGLALCIIPPLVNQSQELYDNRQHIADGFMSTSQRMLEEDVMVQNVIDMLYKNAAPDAAPAEDEGQAPNPTATDSSSMSAELQSETSVATETSVSVGGSNEKLNQSKREEYQEKLQVVIEHHSDYLIEKGVEWASAGGRFLFGMVYVVIGIIIVPVFLFYFLLETEPIAKNWDKILPLRNSRLKDEIVATLSEINQNLVAFVRGQMLVSLIDAIILGIALSIMGLEYSLTIAAAVAVLGIIPYIGMITTSIPAMLIAYFQFGTFSSVLAVAVIFLSVSQFDGWFLQPKIVGKNVKMHDMTVMFSVLFWSLVFGGVLGALVAVPLTASIKVIFKRYVWEPLTEAVEESADKENASTVPNSKLS